MTDTKHMPTPWHTDGTFFYEGDLTVAILVNSAFIKQDQRERAAHIVKCVNMHDELVEVLSGLMKVYNEPDETICCSGYDCGCQGATVRQQAEHYAREALKKAGAL